MQRPNRLMEPNDSDDWRMEAMAEAGASRASPRPRPRSTDAVVSFARPRVLAEIDTLVQQYAVTEEEASLLRREVVRDNAAAERAISSAAAAPDQAGKILRPVLERIRAAHARAMLSPRRHSSSPHGFPNMSPRATSPVTTPRSGAPTVTSTSSALPPRHPHSSPPPHPRKHSREDSFTSLARTHVAGAGATSDDFWGKPAGPQASPASGSASASPRDRRWVPTRRLSGDSAGRTASPFELREPARAPPVALSALAHVDAEVVSPPPPQHALPAAVSSADAAGATDASAPATRPRRIHLRTDSSPDVGVPPQQSYWTPRALHRSRTAFVENGTLQDIMLMRSSGFLFKSWKQAFFSLHSKRLYVYPSFDDWRLRRDPEHEVRLHPFMQLEDMATASDKRHGRIFFRRLVENDEDEAMRRVVTLARESQVQEAKITFDTTLKATAVLTFGAAEQNTFELWSRSIRTAIASLQEQASEELTRRLRVPAVLSGLPSIHALNPAAAGHIRALRVTNGASAARDAVLTGGADAARLAAMSPTAASLAYEDRTPVDVRFAIGWSQTVFLAHDSTAGDVCRQIASFLGLSNDACFGIVAETLSGDPPLRRWLQDSKPVADFTEKRILRYLRILHLPGSRLEEEVAAAEAPDDAAHRLVLLQAIADLTADNLRAGPDVTYRLASLALRSMEGKYRPNRHNVKTFGQARLYRYLPVAFVLQEGVTRARQELLDRYASLPLSRMQAERTLLREAAGLPVYGSRFFHVHVAPFASLEEVKMTDICFAKVLAVNYVGVHVINARPEYFEEEVLSAAQEDKWVTTRYEAIVKWALVPAARAVAFVMDDGSVMGVFSPEFVEVQKLVAAYVNEKVHFMRAGSYSLASREGGAVGNA